MNTKAQYIQDMRKCSSVEIKFTIKYKYTFKIDNKALNDKF